MGIAIKSTMRNTNNKIAFHLILRLLQVAFISVYIISCGPQTSGMKSKSFSSNDGKFNTPTPTPSPLPSPTPSASPTPQPSPSATPTPSASPTPRPSPTPQPSPSQSPSPQPSPNPSPTQGPTPTPGDCLDVCKFYYWRAIDGHAFNPADMKNCKNPEDPIQMFQSGGSQNWPTVCRAAMYMQDGNQTWLKRYFEIQKLKREPNVGVGFGGTEMFSPTYVPAIAGAVLAVYNESVKRNNTQIQQLSGEWLRAWWGFNALTGVSTPIRKAFLHVDERKNLQELETHTANEGYDGLALAMAGTRTRYWRGPVSANHPIASLALNYYPRKYSSQITRDTSIAFRYILEKNNFSISSKNKTNISQKDISAQTVGLTSTQQSDLNNFVKNNGQGLQKIKPLIGNYKAACTYSFLRTTEGVISWMGTSSSDGQNCNGNKPPYFAVSINKNNGEAHYLFPENKIQGAGPGRVWRDSQRICAQAASSGIKDCIQIPPGNVIYEVSFTKEQGFVCVQGDCN